MCACVRVSVCLSVYVCVCLRVCVQQLRIAFVICSYTIIYLFYLLATHVRDDDWCTFDVSAQSSAFLVFHNIGRRQYKYIFFYLVFERSLVCFCPCVYLCGITFMRVLCWLLAYFVNTFS